MQEEKEYKRQYRLTSWWLNHRELLKKIAYGMFVAFDAILLLVAGWNLFNAFVLAAPKERLAVAKMVAYGQDDLHAYTLSQSARELETGSLTTLSTGEGKYDFYTTLSNPNEDWWAEFTYQYRWAGGETEFENGFILPGEEKPIVIFAVESSAAPRGVDFVLSEIVWHRVDHHMTGGPYEAWAAERLNFAIENVAFGTTELDETLGRITFDVTNQTAYSYYEPVFYLVLRRGSSVVGVNRTTLSDLESGEQASVVVNWFGTVPTVSRVEVIPEIQVFDVDAYKPLEGETSVDTRTRVFPGRRR